MHVAILGLGPSLEMFVNVAKRLGGVHAYCDEVWGINAVGGVIHIGVDKVSLYGCDYTYPNAHDAEKGRGCLEFWLGQAAARGISIALPKNTSLMDALNTRQERLYGYDTLDIAMDVDADNRIRVTQTPHDRRMSADELEARYDHGVHPNALVTGD